MPEQPEAVKLNDVGLHDDGGVITVGEAGKVPGVTVRSIVLLYVEHPL